MVQRQNTNSDKNTSETNSDLKHNIIENIKYIYTIILKKGNLLNINIFNKWEFYNQYQALKP